jgi:hypothetical protein
MTSDVKSASKRRVTDGAAGFYTFQINQCLPIAKYIPSIRPHFFERAFLQK